MTKITAEHLARSAYVYIRQFTPGQFVHNHESRHRQYALADHRAGVPEHVGRHALLEQAGLLSSGGRGVLLEQIGKAPSALLWR